MKTILTTITAFLVASTAAFAVPVSTVVQTEADIAFATAVHAAVRLENCRSGSMETHQLRGIAIQDAAKVSGRNIEEVIVEVTGRASLIGDHMKRQGRTQELCEDGSRAKAVYQRMTIDTQPSEMTKERISRLDRYVNEITASKLALKTCNLDEGATEITKAFISDAQEYILQTSGIRWRGTPMNRELAAVLEAIADNEALCSEHSAVLDGLKTDPVFIR